MTSNPESNAIYAIKRADSEYVELYITSNTGQVFRVINEADIQKILGSKLAALGTTKVYPNIAERNKATPTEGMQAYVLDASADSTVSSGAATYIYTGSTWVKTAEAESMDLVMNYANLVGAPRSTPTEIDTAVGKAHSHDNMTVLNQLSEGSDGNLQYRGNGLKTTWKATNW